ncbi:PKD domain containing protein [Thiorhodococcus drewsii AZ1]|uniref:PKD domain containing protein n=1 Tax=Thiorhodococcus drewsii AZ1 TaxID=765913 RepID=G2E0J7_9GAMM|nr:PKD domain-containing protein [Thiorhodococcus drewsii]EGV31925.1 PKD domain containing protein [Thiorhodococcus drewsii AZ1]
MNNPLMRGLLFCVVLLGVGVVVAEDRVRLVTFGPEAHPGKGDDDFTEVVYIQVPDTAPAPLFLRVWDPDLGGAEDEPNGLWNGRTRFSLFGGEGAFGQAGPTADPAVWRSAGHLLGQAEFGEDASTDGRWETLVRFSPDQGERVGELRVFRLVVEGVAGDDGNLYDLAVSSDADSNRSVEGPRLLDYRPTFSVPPGPDRLAEAVFALPSETSALRIRQFDLDRVRIQLELPFMAPVPLRASGEARWEEARIALDPGLGAERAAIQIRGGRTLLNDLVLEAADQSGAPLAFELPIRLRPPSIPPEPQADIAILDDCLGVSFDAGRSDGRDDALTAFIWDFGDGRQGRGERLEHRYAEPGLYQVTLTVIDDSGRVMDRARLTTQLKVNRPPLAVPGPKRTVAPGDAVSFDAAASSDTDGRIIDYRWDFGDGAQVSGVRVSHTYDQPGRYPVRLLVQDDGPGPCTDTRAETLVWVNAQPIARAGDDRRATVGEVLVLDAGASGDPDGALRAFNWDLGDGQTADGVRVEHAYAAPGRYRVLLSVEDDAGVGNSRAEDDLLVWINDPPLAAASGPDRGAVGQTLVFDASASSDPDGALVEYRWDFGDGGTASGVNVEHAYAAPGRYSVRLDIRDDSGTGSATASTAFEVVVNAPPLADAGEDVWVTASEVRFDASGSSDADGHIIAYDWDFGDGTQGVGPTPVHVYAVAGTYAVRLTVTDDSGTPSASSQDSMQVRINAGPVADAGPNHLVAPGETLNFDGAGSFDPDGRIQDYAWDFGDGTSATGVAPSHAYAEPGLYQVRLRVADDSGHAEAIAFAEASVRVNAAPVALAGADLLVAPGQEILLDGSGSYDPDGRIVSYRWTFDDGRAAVETDKTALSFAEPGSYSARLAVTDDSGASNGHAEDRRSIRVNHRPVASAGEPVQTCETLVAFDGSGSSDADGDSLNYRWSFGDDGADAQGPRVAHRFAEGGRYPVVLTVDDGTGLDNAIHAASTQVWIHRRPLAVIEAPALVCAGDLVLFNGLQSRDPDEGRLLYAWDFGDGSDSHSATPAKSFARGGLYPVTLRVEDGSGLECDSSTDRRMVRVVDAPVAEAGEDLQVCANTPVTFDGTASRDFDGVVNSYHWDFGDGTEGGGSNPTHLFSQAGDYSVTLTITGDQVGSCDNSNSDRLSVVVLDTPQVELTAPAQVALGESVVLSAHPLDDTLDASRSDLVYSWDLGDGTQAEGASVEHAYREPGRYLLSMTADDGSGGDCSRLTLEHAIQVNAPPVAQAGDDRVAAPGEILLFDASASRDPDGAIRRYVWDFGDGAGAEGIQTTHVYRQPGDYAVRLTVTDDTDLPNATRSDTLAVRCNAAPLPAFEVRPEIACPTRELVLDASGSSDPDGALTAWRWDLGDGAGAEGAEIHHAYAEPGRYWVVLQVSDDSGAGNALATLGREVRVNQAPVARLDRPLRGCPGESIRFSGLGSSDADGRIAAYRWSFGDGAEAEGAEVEHVYSDPGRYALVLRVEDDSGSDCASAEERAEVRVNAAPRVDMRADSRVAYLGGAHDDVLFDASGSSDADGDPLRFRWDFGDGHQGRGSKVRHAFGAPGLYRVRVEVADDSASECATASAEIEIEVKSRSTN